MKAILYTILFIYCGGCSSSSDNTQSQAPHYLKVLTSSIAVSNVNLDQHIMQLMDDISKGNAVSQSWIQKARYIEQKSTQLANYIEATKVEVMQEAGQQSPAGPFNANDTEATKRLFLEKGRGIELYQRLVNYNKDLLSIDTLFITEFKNVPVDISIHLLNKNLDNDWEQGYFYNTPALAAICFLSKFQYDVKTIAALMLEAIRGKIYQNLKQN